MIKNVFSFYKHPCVCSNYMKIFYSTKSFNKKEILNKKQRFDYFESEDGMDLDEFNVNSAQEAEQKQTQQSKDILRMQIIKQKYFKPPKEINFLSWSQKQTIKFLHNSDSDKWTIEKIAEQYPVTISGLMKLLNSSDWKTFNIVKHDKDVAKNWELLSQNKLTIDKDVKDHLMKFSKEQHKYFETRETKYLTGSNKQLKNGEFSNFIKNLENSETLEQPENYEKRYSGKFEDHLIAPRSKKPYQTLEDFKKKHKLESKMISNENPKNDFISLNHRENVKENEDEGIINHNEIGARFNDNENFEERFIEKSKEKKMDSYNNSKVEYKSKSVDNIKDLKYKILHEDLIEKSKDNTEQNSFKIQNRPKEVSRIENSNTHIHITTPDSLIVENNMEQNITLGEYIPYRVQIPKDKYKPGATYRVRDLFYDDDGTFLYKVPGLMK